MAAGMELKKLLNPESRDAGLKSDITVGFLGDKNENKKATLKSSSKIICRILYFSTLFEL